MDACSQRKTLLSPRLAGDTAILPVGSLEWHCGAPMGTDSLIAEWVAEKLCSYAATAGCKPVLLPTIYYGASSEWSGYQEVSVSRRALADIVAGIASSLERHGFKRLVLVNGHGGNSAALRYAVETLVYERGSRLEVYIVEWWRLVGHTLGHMDAGEAALLERAAGVAVERLCECSGLSNPYGSVECREARGEPDESIVEKLEEALRRLAGMMCGSKNRGVRR